MSLVDFDDLLKIRKGDERLTTGMTVSTIGEITTAEEWLTKADALREIFLSTLGRRPEVSCDLDCETVSEEDCGDHVRRTVQYSLEPDERISAYVLIPKGLKDRAPGVLCIHPTTPLGKEQTIGNDNTATGRDRAYALHLVRRGYVTVAYDLMSAGTRCYPGCKHFDTGPFYEKYPEWSARGKDLWDAARAVDLLRTMDEVAPEKIGSIGHSQGGGITIHAMAVDERIKAGVSSCGHWPHRLSKNPFNNCRTEWWVGRPLLRPYCRAGKPLPIDMHELLGLAAPRAVMNITALNDCKYGPEEESFTRPAFENLDRNVEKVFALLGSAASFRNIIHMKGHGFGKSEREAAYMFLDEQLKTN